MMPIDWGKAFEYMYGHPAGEPEAPWTPLLKVMCRDFAEALYKRSKEIIRQIGNEADRAGLSHYRQYVFYTFMERFKEWPSLTAQRKAALLVVRDILLKTGDIPDYNDGLKVPPKELEQNVDKVIRELAEWAAGTFKHSVFKDYKAIEKQSLPAMRKVYPDWDNGLYDLEVGSLFDSEVQDHPMVYPEGHFLSNVLSNLLFY